MKKKFYQFLVSLGYTVADNGVYRDSFPYLMLRTGNRKYYTSLDVRYDQEKLVLDIFSSYDGEKEILEIADNIINHLQEVRDENVTFAGLDNMVIIPDTKTGPVRQHGIMQFNFILTSSIGGESSDSVGD